ncbi:MAG: AGE family epimerase/isomerase [Pseudomonadota bacterium]
MRIYPVIMCGGAGSRLWPASRPSRPKQFVSLDGGLSIFQQTVQRVAELDDGGRPIVVAGARYESIIRRQLAELGVEALLLLEPEARDSGPAMAAAAALIHEMDPEGVAAIVASDHHIPDHAAFRQALVTAARAAVDGWVVTLGVQPAGPSTAYGYINPGAPEGEVRRVLRFVEKPDAATAVTFVSDGYLWNSGNFVVSARTLLAELARHAPELGVSASAAVLAADRAGGAVRMGEAFLGAPKISIDYAVMEKTDRAAVLPVDFIWSDLGAWDAIHAAGTGDAGGNVVSGEALVLDSSGSFVRNDGPQRVAVVGLRNLAVIVEHDAVLICALDSSQSVKRVVDHLKTVEARELDIAAEPSLADWRDRYEAWLRTTALPVWWGLGADFAQGGFHESLDDQARPTAADRRSRVQTRQTYVYATAAAKGWAGPWRQAALHGLDFFLERYSRDDGRFVALVSPAGEVLDDTPVLYDQAFALLAMGSVLKIAPERTDIADRAKVLLAGLALMRAPNGGFRENGAWPYQANAQMHLLEATMSWFELTGEPAWGEVADEIVALALEKFIDPEGGFLREVFNEAWNPAAGDDGRFIEPGHQFEWAWLLLTWSRLRGGKDVAAAIDGLMAAGRRGIDQKRGVAVNELWTDLSVRQPSARLWPQTEWLRAAVAMLRIGKGSEDEVRQAAKALWVYLQTPTPGLWRDKLGADGLFQDEPAPASSLYHILGAVLELQAGTGDG